MISPQLCLGAATGVYSYDGNLKRVKGVVDGKTIYNVYNAAGQLVHVDHDTDGTSTDYMRAAGMTLARIKDTDGVNIYHGAETYLHNDHLGSVAAGTDAAGTLLWTEHHSPYGEPLSPNAANDNEATFTGHIRDKATGLNYMQARYMDPVIGRFLSIDPVTFMDTGNPGMFNRYAYTFNDPVNMVDPDGEEAWLISRPLGSKIAKGKNHMFVAVKNDKTGAIRRFSYGPQGNPIFTPGKLVSLTENGGRTDVDDGNALTSFLADPVAATKSGIAAELINASDADVIASGEAVDSKLGTQDSPEKNAPYYRITPLKGSNTANSNSAAYAVADRANPSSTQAVPNQGDNPGQRAHTNVPTTGTRIKRDRE